MEQPTLTRKEALWLACKEKSCCYTPFVIPTGRDVWRIVRALDAPPAAFLAYFETPQPRRDAFALDGSPRRFRLALGKGATRRTKSPPPCVFLLRTRTGHHRCGLGDLRPQVCRAFPADMVEGVLYLRAGVGCTCRVWGLADVDVAAERAAVTQRQAEAEEYCALVARWNAQVAAAPADVSLSFAEYCDFVLAAYDALAAARVAGGETA